MQNQKLIQSWKQKFNSMGADGIDFVASPERNPDGTQAAEIYCLYCYERRCIYEQTPCRRHCPTLQA